MNRATRRLLAKQEREQEKQQARPGGGGAGDGKGRPPTARGFGGGRTPSSRPAAAPGEPREGRIKRFRRFLREVRIELRKVAWPTRGEVVTYTVVVLVAVTAVTLFVFGVDYGVAKAVLFIFE